MENQNRKNKIENICIIYSQTHLRNQIQETKKRIKPKCLKINIHLLLKPDTVFIPKMHVFIV